MPPQRASFQLSTWIPCEEPRCREMEPLQPRNPRIGHGAAARKWINLVAALWVQALTGTNFDFSAYSSSLKQVLNISQVQLNNLAVASDLGKGLAWLSGYALLHLPMWVVLFIAAFLGLVGYGVQLLVISHRIASIQYWQMYFLCLMAGNSICWFNTVCFVICIRSFPARKGLALGLTTAYNGLTAAIIALIVQSIALNNESLYLLLNALLPLAVSCVVVTFLRNLPSREDGKPDGGRLNFVVLNIMAVVLGAYLLTSEFLSFEEISSYRIYAVGMAVLLLAPLSIPGAVYVRGMLRSNRAEGGGDRFSNDDGELGKPFLSDEEEERETECGDRTEEEQAGPEAESGPTDSGGLGAKCRKSIWFPSLAGLGEEHTWVQLIRSVDFWTYFFVYFCGATPGLVYSNNLGQIAQSRGHSDATVFVSLYSSSAFFGRLASAAPDFFPRAREIPRTGWMVLGIIPMAPAFFLLASGVEVSLYVSTAIIGLSSGFVVSTAVSTTPEMFGMNSCGVNHNILIANIPLGSLVFGYIAAVIYDKNANEGNGIGEKLDTMIVCMGRNCYRSTFLIWGCVCLFGFVLNCILFARTRRLYDAPFNNSVNRTGNSRQSTI